eukprot:4035797-Amphidinium_carterae.3
MPCKWCSSGRSKIFTATAAKAQPGTTVPSVWPSMPSVPCQRMHRGALYEADIARHNQDGNPHVETARSWNVAVRCRWAAAATIAGCSKSHIQVTCVGGRCVALQLFSPRGLAGRALACAIPVAALA